jgi:uncharacterized protein
VLPIWSAPAAEMLNFPAENFVAFFGNHQLLQYDPSGLARGQGRKPPCVEKLVATFRERLRLGCAVTSIERTSHGEVVHDSRGRSDTPHRSMSAR